MQSLIAFLATPMQLVRQWFPQMGTVATTTVSTPITDRIEKLKEENRQTEQKITQLTILLRRLVYLDYLTQSLNSYQKDAGHLDAEAVEKVISDALLAAVATSEPRAAAAAAKKQEVPVPSIDTSGTAPVKPRTAADEDVQVQVPVPVPTGDGKVPDEEPTAEEEGQTASVDGNSVSL
jgi:hypothetical protein